MITRILENTLQGSPKSLILMGPRQVGKSTLAARLGPTLTINLADEETFQQHARDSGLLKRLVQAHKKPGPVLIDEVQRIPSLLNTIQALIDQDRARRFLLTGSSARKLKRGQANLLPGRVFWKHLSPLLYWEIGESFDLEKALSRGCLPEVYLEDYGPELLTSYASTYLREEIQAEALTKDLGAYGRFLDLAAEMSGQYINYTKVSSDAEAHKDTIRRYFEILHDTLLIEKIEPYRSVPKARKARQRDRFVFFDLGVRNAILGRERSKFSREEMGDLFEQWIILQVIYFNRTFEKNWKISSYRDDGGIEVDLIIEENDQMTCIEIKSAKKATLKMTKNLIRFEEVSNRRTKKIIVYQGESRQKFENGVLVVPFRKFLDELAQA